MDVRELKDEMDGRFEQVDRRFEELTQQISAEAEATRRYFDAEGEKTRRYFDTEGEKTRRYVDAEGEKTRRHFDLVAEQMKAEQILLIDRAMGTHQQVLGLTASNAADHVGFVNRLDDHEQRLKRIEKK